MRSIALAVGLFLVLFGFVIGLGLQYAFDLHCFYLVLGGALAFTYVAHQKNLWRAIAVGFLGKEADPETRAHSVQVLKTLRRVLVSMGITIAFVGAINMSRGLENLADFGPAFSVLLLAPFYGVVFGELIVLPAIRHLEVDPDV